MKRIIARPVLVLGVVLLVLLAMTGVGYGLWAKTLTIEGTVFTGEMNAEYSLHEVDETADFNGGSVGNGVWDEAEFEGKDVAQCVVEPIGPDLMLVTIFNGYPSFNCFVLYNIYNNGTIPVKVHAPAFNNPFPAELHVNGWPLLSSLCPADPLCIPYEDDVQLHPGEYTLASLHVHVEQPAAMNAVYSFTVTNFVHQWNEEP